MMDNAAAALIIHEQHYTHVSIQIYILFIIGNIIYIFFILSIELDT